MDRERDTLSPTTVKRVSLQTTRRRPVPSRDQAPSPDREVRLVGELPDWVVSVLENTRFGDGPK